MAHEFDTGMFARTPAWHGLGNVLEEAPKTWDDARKAAGLLWEPIETAGYVGIPRIGKDGPYTEYVEMPDHKIIVRSDTGAVLAPANKSYELITHKDMGTVIDTILSDRRYTFDALISLRGGAKVAAVMELGDPIQVKGDPSATRRYGIMLNSHDGSSACRFIAVNVRVVCMNTWKWADTVADADGTAYTFRHSAGWMRKLDEVAAEARQAIAGAQQQINQYREMCDALSAMQVRADQVDRFCDEFVYSTRDEHKLKPRSLNNVIKGRAELRAILNSETCAGIENTAYGLMQAGGEWADHVRPYQDKATLFGRSVIRTEDLKAKSKTLAVAAAEGRL
jgi:phage/plasmid-like protein (TIGR03299 family)